MHNIRPNDLISANHPSEAFDGALQLTVPQQKLVRAQVAGFLVDQGHLCPSKAVGAIGAWVQVDDLERVRPTSLLLNNRRALPDDAALSDITKPELHDHSPAVWRLMRC